MLGNGIWVNLIGQVQSFKQTLEILFRAGILFIYLVI